MTEGNITDFIIIFAFAIIAYTYYESKTSELTYVVCPHDNNRYLVRNLPDKDRAVAILARMRKKLSLVVETMSNTYSKDERVRRLKNGFNPNNISETAGNSSYTSYSVNKGEKLVLCIRDKKNVNNFIDDNTLFFVALHELAHIMTKSIGHTEEFWENFRFVLKEATGMGEYRCVNYDTNPKKYCGIEITNTPLKCSI